MTKSGRRKIFTSLVLLVAVAGTALASIPFGASMKPSERALAARSQHDISGLEPGDYRLETYNRKSAWPVKVLFIRDWDSQLYLYILPIEEGLVPLPERYWWWSIYGCSDFRPELGGQQKIVKNGVVTCHDDTVSDWGKKKWRWSYSGKAVDTSVPDMWAPTFEIRGNVLHINR